MIGPLVDEGDVCAAVEATLRLWLPSVLDEQHALGKPRLADPATFEQLPDESASTTALFPALLVSCLGVTGEPERRGDGSYDAVYNVVVSVVFRGKSYRDTTFGSYQYVAAVVAALTQHSDLGGLASATTWTDQGLGRISTEAARTLSMRHAMFSVAVDSVVNAYDGPAVPPAPGALNPDAPTALDTSVSVLKES